jgi:hypothetical protein
MTTVHLPDEWETTDRTTLRNSIIAALTENLSVQKQIKHVLAAAGFNVARVQKHWFHHVYEIRMQRGATMRDCTAVELGRKIRRALKAERIYYDRETFALSITGRTLICAFCYRLGSEGFI